LGNELPKSINGGDVRTRCDGGSVRALFHVRAVRSLCPYHRISTRPTGLTRLLAVTTLPPVVTSMLRTMSPPPGNGQVWKLSVFGSNFTSVFGFANDPLYQTAPFAKAMPLGGDGGPLGEDHYFT